MGNNKLFNSNSRKSIVSRIAKDNYIILESDFYPPEDNRQIHSNLRTVKGQPSFNEYLQEYIELGEEEGFIEDN